MSKRFQCLREMNKYNILIQPILMEQKERDQFLFPKILYFRKFTHSYLIDAS